MSRFILVKVVSQKEEGMRITPCDGFPDSFLWRIVASTPAEGYREPFLLTKGRGGSESILTATHRTVLV